jgi:general secretion pathway protein A
MYNEYFGLIEAPFSIAPNPQYLYMSDRHREALAHLLYGIKSDGGFILLTGEVGTGKTTVCRCLLEQIPDEVDIAFILNPKLTVTELLATVCDDLGISYPTDAGIKSLVDNLNAFLLTSYQDGRRTVLIIDEAQNLSVDVLEQLRLLTNLETNQRKLLQIILLGQPELLDILARNELRQLSQRVTARFHLEALNKEDVHEYIRHRLSVAGAKGMFFPRSTINRIYKISGGIPRVINLICDRALLGTYAENKLQVNPAIVTRAAEEVLGHPSRKSETKYLLAIAASFVFLVTMAVTWNTMRQDPDSEHKSELSSNLIPASTTEPVTELISQPGSTGGPTSGSNSGFAVESEVANISPISSGNNIKETNPVLPSDLYNLNDVIGHDDAKQAFADLFALWGISFEDQNSHPCDQAITIGLKCYSNLGGIKEVSNLNRPLIVGINNQWVTLSHLNNGIATLISGHRQYEVSARQFFESWNGKFTLFWRTPPAYDRPNVLGDEGPTIDWLSSQLAIIESQPLTMTTEYGYNQELENSVKKFQQESGLIPDGIVGVKTWIHINSVEGVNIPFLNQDLAGGESNTFNRGEG